MSAARDHRPTGPPPLLPLPPLPPPTQDVPGQVHSFVEHIKMGVEEAARDPGALLLFSGGKTRRDAGPRAEGEGYWLVAEVGGYWACVFGGSECAN